MQTSHFIFRQTWHYQKAYNPIVGTSEHDRTQSVIWSDWFTLNNTRLYRDTSISSVYLLWNALYSNKTVALKQLSVGSHWMQKYNIPVPLAGGQIVTRGRQYFGNQPWHKFHDLLVTQHKSYKLFTVSSQITCSRRYELHFEGAEKGAVSHWQDYTNEGHNTVISRRNERNQRTWRPSLASTLVFTVNKRLNERRRVAFTLTFLSCQELTERNKVSSKPILHEESLTSLGSSYLRCSLLLPGYIRGSFYNMYLHHQWLLDRCYN